MADAFLGLSRAERREALEFAAAQTSRPAHLLEKDVWVVWALDVMFCAPLGAHLVFKGGTSLSKVYNAIRRFSEDVDLTYDMRELAGDIVGHDAEPTPASKSQARKWSDAIRERLVAWVADTALSAIGDAIKAARLPAVAVVDPSDAVSILVEYDRVAEASSYTSHAVKLEFGARSTGEPCAVYRVVCDAAAAVPALVFPMASPRVMSGERTFWEKATAIHVFASGGKFRGQSRFSRHWYDVMQLGAAGFADRAVRDRPLAHAVAQHKAAFFVEKDDAGQVIDYEQAVGGNLRLVPLDGDLLRLRDDYQKMVNDGLLMDEAVPFEEVMRRCRAIEARANEAARR